ncbi:MAG: tripartite tricarboxylate transporter substrate binding protein [Spirochaetes bacterium]|nr:MAG: tripartite tricarboxylate transporter substrate binding protein [Spirochaetota bacterium]
MEKKSLFLLIFTLVFILSNYAEGQKEEVWPDPEKSITVVVPYSAGGGTDLIFRPLVEEMKKFTEANIIVSNISGAGSSKGTNEVLNLPADGYTLLASGTHTVSATLQGLTDGYKELEGIAGLNWDPFIVAVLKEKPWQNMQDLVSAAKKNPGTISLGNAGMGGATGVASVGMNLAFGGVFNVTPFNGGKDLRVNVLGGHCDVGIFSQSEILANQDKLKPLVILYNERSRLKDLNGVPTLKEAGFENLDVPGGSFRSISVKKGTPEHIKDKLIEIVRQAYNSQTYQNFMKENGLILAYYEGKELDEYFKKIEQAYITIMREAGLLR